MLLQKTESADSPVKVRLPALIEHLPDFIEPVLALAKASQVDEEMRKDLGLALEEALVNICSYAYPVNPGFIDLVCRIADSRLLILIQDEGVPFSVTSSEHPDISSGITERKIGGLGIHLINSLMDDVRYKRQGNRNLLELTLFIHPQSV